MYMSRLGEYIARTGTGVGVNSFYVYVQVGGVYGQNRDRSGSKILVCIYRLGECFPEIGTGVGVNSLHLYMSRLGEYMLRTGTRVGVNSFYLYVQVGGVFARNRDRSGSKLLVVTVRKHYKDSTKSLVRTVISGVCKDRQISIEIVMFFLFKFSQFSIDD